MKTKNKCPYKYKDFEKCPACFEKVNPSKLKPNCPNLNCGKDIKKSYMENVKNGNFA